MRPDIIYDCHTNTISTDDRQVIGWFKFYGSDINNEYFRMAIKDKSIAYRLATIKDIKKVTYEDVRLYYKLRLESISIGDDPLFGSPFLKCISNESCANYENCKNCKYYVINHYALITYLKSTFTIFKVPKLEKMFERLIEEYER